MLKRFVEWINGFKEDVRGSVKLLVGLSTPFLLLITGAGVDTAELYRARVNFQNAVDAGTLMAAKTLAATGSTSQAAAAGEEMFYGNIRNIAANVTTTKLTTGLSTLVGIVNEGRILSQSSHGFIVCF